VTKIFIRTDSYKI